MNWTDYQDVYWVYDHHVAPMAERLMADCPGLRASMALDATEASKTMDSVLDICRWLLSEGAGRGALLVGMGGGITTDLCGFAASVYMRGIRFGFIPTTLLAQVDAAIGGKNGVNLDGYKNMVGVIREPEFVWILPETLTTLPPREWRNGAAELLKTFLIDNTGGCYEKAVRQMASPVIPDRIGDLITAAGAVKRRIVAEDLYERGLRKKLNLGHTFAHAIERLSSGAVSHGEAVAMGIQLAATLSARLGLCEKALPARLRADFAAAGLPVECPFPLQELSATMRKDKKAADGKVDFVLIRDIGDVVIVPLTVSEVMEILR